jgi:phytoene dehydrogenase-like protein
MVRCLTNTAWLWQRACTRWMHEQAVPTHAAVRKVIPDIDSRVEVSLVGTPLTHERFLRRSGGTYGPGDDMERGSY